MTSIDLYSDSNIEVRESPIDRRGIFAKRRFERGEAVCVWDTSHEVSEAEIDALPKEDKQCVARYDGKWIVQQSPARYMNHSCESNTRSDNGKDVAIRTIEVGEEITTDYRPEMMKGETMECGCGAASCKGVIVGVGE